MADRAGSSRDAGRTQPPSQQPAVIGIGFLLSAIGMHSAAQYAQRVVPLGLTPPHVGVLRAIAVGPGRSQQSIADEFGMPPSRMVAFIDDLEAQKLVERRRDPHDRRVHLLHLTASGQKMMRKLAETGRGAEDELLRSLTPAEREELRGLLQRVADDANLTPGVHPGYRRMKADRGADPPLDCTP